MAPLRAIWFRIAAPGAFIAAPRVPAGGSESCRSVAAKPGVCCKHPGSHSTVMRPDIRRVYGAPPAAECDSRAFAETI